MRAAVLLSLLALASMSLEAQSYRAVTDDMDGLRVVRLSSPDGGASVAIAPSIGNIAYEYLVGGRNVFYFPYESLRRVCRAAAVGRQSAVVALGQPPGARRILRSEVRNTY